MNRKSHIKYLYIITMKEMNNTFISFDIFARAPGITGAKGITMDNEKTYMITFFCKKDINMPADTFFVEMSIDGSIKAVYEMIAKKLKENDYIYVATEKVDGKVIQSYGLRTSTIEGFKIDEMREGEDWFAAK